MGWTKNITDLTSFFFFFSSYFSFLKQRSHSKLLSILTKLFERAFPTFSCFDKVFVVLVVDFHSGYELINIREILLDL